MKQFANYFHIAPAFRVSSVTNNAIVMKSGYTADRFTTHNEVDPAFDTGSKTAGKLYQVKVNLAVDKLTDAQKNFYANNAPVIIALLDVENALTVILGTPSNPATVTFTPGLNHDQLLIEYTSKTPVL